MPTDRKLRVFLCYSSEDKFAVWDFYNKLSAENWIYPWLDEEEILPGMNWEVEIEKAVEIADAVIVFLSNNSVHKEGYVQYELRLVLDVAAQKPETTIFIIPLKLNECEVPPRIRSLQYIDYSLPETREQAYHRLLKSLRVKDDLVNKRTGKTASAHFISSSSVHAPDIEMQDVRTQPNIALLAFSGFKFIQIPRGKFIMGSKASNILAPANEVPQYPCAIPYDYQISCFLVSNEQFSEFAISTKCMATLPKDWRKKLNYPIVNVSWHDAVSYTCWLNEVFGKEMPEGSVFRLPTEAEWERSARGDFAREWPWGNRSLDELLDQEISSHVDNVYYRKMKSEIETLRCTLQATNVGSFSALTDSPYKVADMMGSVSEWTQSLYAPYPYDAQDGRENLDAEGKRVIRGCFTSNQERFSVRSAKRAWAFPDRRASILGFRIVIAPPVL